MILVLSARIHMYSCCNLTRISRSCSCVSWLVRACHCSCWHLFDFLLLYSKRQMSLIWLTQPLTSKVTGSLLITNHSVFYLDTAQLYLALLFPATQFWWSLCCGWSNVSIPAVSTRWHCDPAETTRMWSCSASASEPDFSPVLLTFILETVSLWRSKLACAEITSTSASIKRIFCCSLFLGQTSRRLRLRPSAGIFSSLVNLG